MSAAAVMPALAGRCARVRRDRWALSKAGVGAALALASLAASAGDTVDIPSAYREAAGEYAVPPRILYAVACAESGARLTSGAFRPWPWTLNVAGQGRRFTTRERAFAALQAARAQATDSVDIGLMQVNWHWHRERLLGPWRALDPYFNLRRGAALLLERYRASGDWWTAVGRYHAPSDPARAARYAARVKRQYRRLGGGDD